MAKRAGAYRFVHETELRVSLASPTLYLPWVGDTRLEYSLVVLQERVIIAYEESPLRNLKEVQRYGNIFLLN